MRSLSHGVYRVSNNTIFFESSPLLQCSYTNTYTITCNFINDFGFFMQFGNFMLLFYRVSLSLEAPNYCLCIQSKSAGFSFVNTDKQVHFKTCQKEFRTEFGERRAPAKCCIQKLVKKLETR